MVLERMPSKEIVPSSAEIPEFRSTMIDKETTSFYFGGSIDGQVDAAYSNPEEQKKVAESGFYESINLEDDEIFSQDEESNLIEMGNGPNVRKELAGSAKVFDELPNSKSDFGVSSNLGVNSATIQRSFEQPKEIPKIEDWDRNILGKTPEESKEWLILEDAKRVGNGMKTATLGQENAMEEPLTNGFRKMAIELTSKRCKNSDGKVTNVSQLGQENVDQSFPCQSEFKKGMYSFPKLDFHVKNAFDFSEKMSFEIEPYEEGELVNLWLDQIRIEMSDFGLISASSLGIIGAQYMLDELPTRSFRSIDPRIQLNNGHWPMGNWIIEPGIPSMTWSKWISIVTGNQATTLNKKDCYSCTDFAGLCYPCLVKMRRNMILTFDPGGAFALYATGLVLNSSRGYDSVELLSVFGEFFKSIDRASFFSFDPGGVLGMLFTRLALNSRGIVEQQRQQWDPGGSCLFWGNPFPKPIGATLSNLKEEIGAYECFKEEARFRVFVFDPGGNIQLLCHTSKLLDSLQFIIQLLLLRSLIEHMLML